LSGYGTAFGTDETAPVFNRFFSFLPGLDARLGILVGYRFNR